MIKYIIAQADSPSGLVRVVKDGIISGYVPQGGVACMVDGISREQLFYQAMTSEIVEPPKE